MSRYEESIQVLKLALENGIEASLEAFIKLMHHFGDPQDSYPSIQIAGTNGKTSTSRYTAAILKACGLKTGLYTSPELMFYPERFELEGAVVDNEMFADVILGTWDAIQAAIQSGVVEFTTEFEVLTASAFRLFHQQLVDWAVLEVGLGGLWDATSVVNPKVAVVTGIDLEHTNYLGNTVEEIAVNKAAIIKPGSTAVLGPGTAATRQIFLDRCAEVGADYHIIEPPYMDFRFIGPGYQKINIATAWVAAEKAIGEPISCVTVQKALNKLVVPGRFEQLQDDPLLMIDAAHNPEAARFLADALRERYSFVADSSGVQRLAEIDTLLLGILLDKDSRGIIETLTPLFGQLAVTQSKSPRAIPAEELAALVEAVDGRRPRVYPDIENALANLQATGTTALATGSITVAGEFKARFLGQ
jgi:dihydrofolate synthase/folylpolyglutamate synthase